MKKVLDNGDGTGLVLHHHMDGTGTITFESRQDAEPILEHAKRLHIEGQHGTSEMRHAARFPRVLVDKYCNDNGITFEEWMKDKTHIRRMLSDPDLSYFRVWKGAV